MSNKTPAPTPSSSSPGDKKPGSKKTGSGNGAGNGAGSKPNGTGAKPSLPFRIGTIVAPAIIGLVGLGYLFTSAEDERPRMPNQELRYESATCRDYEGDPIPGAMAIYQGGKQIGYRFAYDGRVLDVRPGGDLQHAGRRIGTRLIVDGDELVHYEAGYTPSGDEPYGNPDAGGILAVYKTCIETAIVEVREMADETRTPDANVDADTDDNTGANASADTATDANLTDTP